MLKCSLSKNKSYPVTDIYFNPSNHGYQIKLAEKTDNCPSGIFINRKVEIKIVADNQVPFLKFNAADNRPELVVNNMSLVKKGELVSRHATDAGTTTQTEATPMAMAQPSQNHVSPVLVFGGIFLVILVIWFALKPKNNQDAPIPSMGNPAPSGDVTNYNQYGQNPYPQGTAQNNPYGVNNNPAYSTPPVQQGPSRTESFLTGMAGGAVGAVVGNAIYDKFKGNGESQGAQQVPPPASDSGAFDDEADGGQFVDDDDSFSNDM
jgi:hypothetical protein